MTSQPTPTLTELTDLEITTREQQVTDAHALIARVEVQLEKLRQVRAIAADLNGDASPAAPEPPAAPETTSSKPRKASRSSSGTKGGRNPAKPKKRLPAGALDEPVLEFITSQGTCSKAAIEDALGVTGGQLSAPLSRLVDAGKITRAGVTSATRYSIAGQLDGEKKTAAARGAKSQEGGFSMAEPQAITDVLVKVGSWVTTDEVRYQLQRRDHPVDGLQDQLQTMAAAGEIRYVSPGVWEAAS